MKYFKYLLAFLVCLSTVFPTTAGQTNIESNNNHIAWGDNYCKTKDGKDGKCVRWAECKADLPNNYVFTTCKTRIRGVCCPTTVTITGLSISTNSGFSESSCLIDNKQPGKCTKFYECESPPNRPKACKNINFRGICCPIKPGARPTCGKDSKQIIKPFAAGSKKAIPGSWPWMAVIRSKTNSLYLCGGAVIRNQYVITAAHCFHDSNDTDNYLVRIGGYDLSKKSKDDQNSEEMKLEKIIIHPSYKQGKFQFDIALLKLEREIKQLDRKICLPGELGEETNLSPNDGHLAGWGLMKFGESTSTGGSTSQFLREVSIPIHNTIKCDIEYRSEYEKKNEYDKSAIQNDKKENDFENHFPNGINESMFICAGILNKTACEGDSGGPLMIRSKEGLWSIIGVVSAGHPICGSNIPALFIRVNSFVPWIYEIAESS